MAYLFSRRQGISSHLQTIWVNGSFILVLYRNWCSYRLEMGVSGNLCIVVKDIKQLFLYDVECEMAMDSMKRKCASSWVDLGYTNLFCIPEVTSVFFCCDRVLRDSLQFHHGNRGSLHLWLGTRNSSGRNAGESGLILQWGGVSWVFSSCGRHLVYILEYGGNGHLKLGFVLRSQDSCLGMTVT